MKKPILVLLSIIFSLACILSSCRNAPADGDLISTIETTESSVAVTDDPSAGTPYFQGLNIDPDRKHLPSIYDFANVILNETTSTELGKLVGNPQKAEYDPYSSSSPYSCSYETSDQYHVTIRFWNSFNASGYSSLIATEKPEALVMTVFIASYTQLKNGKTEIHRYKFVEENGEKILTEYESTIID